MNGYELLCLLLIAFSHKSTAQNMGGSEAEDYDVGCNRRHAEFIRTDSRSLLLALREGATVPNCAEGGVYRNVQCGLLECFCAYIDTGNVISGINVSNETYDQQLQSCPIRTEFPVNSCERAPLNYPCDLTQVKYRYNNETQTCEEVTVSCFGFSTRNFCEETCAVEEVQIDLDIQSRFQFRVVVPLWVVYRYELQVGVINPLGVNAFINVTRVASSVRLLRTTTTEATTTTTTTTEAPTTNTLPEEFVPEEVLARSGSTPSVVCNQRNRGGPCRGFFPRWYFDQSQSRCVRFIYGGCTPNGNNFEDYVECGQYCGAANPPTDEDLEAHRNFLASRV